MFMSVGLLACRLPPHFICLWIFSLFLCSFVPLFVSSVVFFLVVSTVFFACFFFVRFPHVLWFSYRFLLLFRLLNVLFASLWLQTLPRAQVTTVQVRLFVSSVFLCVSVSLLREQVCFFCVFVVLLLKSDIFRLVRFVL